MIRWIKKWYYGTGYEFRNFTSSELDAMLACIELLSRSYKSGNISEEDNKIIGTFVHVMRSANLR